MWFCGGVEFIHSFADEDDWLKLIVRLEASASHKMNSSITKDTNEIRLPNEEITFQVVKASG